MHELCMSVSPCTFRHLILLQVIRWNIIGAVDIASEVALFAMSILLVQDLKMDFGKKAFVVIAFGLRLP